MTAKRTTKAVEESVIVSEQLKPVTVVDMGGNIVQLGSIRSRVYEGEEVQRHEFITANLSNQSQQVMANPQNFRPDLTYRLGPTTTEFKFVDHSKALEPLLRNGYQMKDLKMGKGGLSLYAIMEPEDSSSLPDPIQWDDPFWPKTDKNGNLLTIRESVIVTTSVKPGKAIVYRRGWFRQICTNGLTAEVLDLGGIRMNHANFNPEKVLTALNLERSKTGDLTPASAMGPVIGNVNGVSRMATLLRSILTTDELPEADQDDDEDLSMTDRLRDQELPLFVREAVGPFVRQPNWYISSLADQFEAIANHYQRGDVRALDLANAVTTPINLHAQGEDGQLSFRSLTRTQALIHSSMKLIGAYSLI